MPKANALSNLQRQLVIQQQSREFSTLSRGKALSDYNNSASLQEAVKPKNFQSGMAPSKAGDVDNPATDFKQQNLWQQAKQARGVVEESCNLAEQEDDPDSYEPAQRLNGTPKHSYYSEHRYSQDLLPVGGDLQVSSPSVLSYANMMQPKSTITCPPSVTAEEDRISICGMPTMAFGIKQTPSIHRCQRPECLLNERQIQAQQDYIAFLENQLAQLQAANNEPQSNQAKRKLDFESDESPK